MHTTNGGADVRSGKKAKPVLVIVKNEIVLKGLGKSLERLGFEARRDIGDCPGAEFGFVCSYFAALGAANQIREASPTIKIILLLDATGGVEAQQNIAGLRQPDDFYDVIRIYGNNENETVKTVLGWFVGMGIQEEKEGR